MEDLILVTGCTLSTSWALAVFDDNARLSLRTQEFHNGGADFFWNIHGNIKYRNSLGSVRSPAYVSRRELILIIPSNHTRFLINPCP